MTSLLLYFLLQGAIKTTECKVILDRNDHCRMRVRAVSPARLEKPQRLSNARVCARSQICRADCLLTASPLPAAAQIEDAEKMFFDVTFRNGEERDIYALTLRELAGDSLELRNAPEYMAGYTPSDEEGEEEED